VLVELDFIYFADFIALTAPHYGTTYGGSNLEALIQAVEACNFYNSLLFCLCGGIMLYLQAKLFH